MANFGFLQTTDFHLSGTTPTPLTDADPTVPDSVDDRLGTARNIVGLVDYKNPSTEHVILTLSAAINGDSTITCHPDQVLYNKDGNGFLAKNATVLTYLTDTIYIDTVNYDAGVDYHTTNYFRNLWLDGGTSYELLEGVFVAPANTSSF